MKFWTCPVAEHRDRHLVVTVEWHGDTAHCTAPDCVWTSDMTRLVIDRYAQHIEAKHEQAMLEVLAERDQAREAADDLAGMIARLTGVDIGEHSNLNDPWRNALAAAEHHTKAGAP